MEITLEELNLELETPFTISRGTTTVSHNILCIIDEEETRAFGEASPSSYYGETPESVKEVLTEVSEKLPSDVSPVQHIILDLLDEYPNARSALCALDIALYDLLGKRLNAPLYRILALDPSRTPKTSFTIGIEEPDLMVERAVKAAKEYPILKIKLGTEKVLGKDVDVRVIESIRAKAPDATIRIDANCAWELDEASDKIYALQSFEVEFYEQPLPPSEPQDWGRLKEAVPDALIFADESCAVPSDIPKVADLVDGINIKLAKCGGITEALCMIKTARSYGLRTMLGCMVESSCLITAAAQISPLVDYADLDGNLLCLNDPFEGVTIEDGKLVLPDRPGIGLIHKG